MFFLKYYFYISLTKTKTNKIEPTKKINQLYAASHVKKITSNLLKKIFNFFISIQLYAF
jgi:hypothetical protein